MTLVGDRCPVCHQRKDVRGSCTHNFHVGFEGIFDTNALMNEQLLNTMMTSPVPYEGPFTFPTIDETLKLLGELDRLPILAKLRMHPCTLPTFKDKVGISESAPTYVSSFLQLPIHEDPSVPPGYIEFRDTKGNLMKLYKLDHDSLSEIIFPPTEPQ